MCKEMAPTLHMTTSTPLRFISCQNLTTH